MKMPETCEQLTALKKEQDQLRDEVSRINLISKALKDRIKEIENDIEYINR